MKQRWRLILGATFFALLFVYCGSLFSKSVALLSMNSEPGWLPHQQGERVVVRQQTLPSNNPSLKIGDEVLAINGVRLTDVAHFAEQFQDVAPGTTYLVTIRRNGQTMDMALKTRPIPLLSWIITGAGTLIIPSIFLLTGFAVFVLKPYDKQAFLLSMMFGMFIGALMATAPLFGDTRWWIVGMMMIVQIVSLFLWPIFLHFFLIFPEPSPVLNRFPRLEYLLYIPQLITIFPYFTALNLLGAIAPEKAPSFAATFFLLGAISVVLFVLYFAAGLLVLLINYRAAGRVSRRKMRVVVAGSIAGFLPIFIVIGLAIFFDLPETQNRLWRWLASIAFFAFPLFPLSFAYAIIRHQVIPVRLILRRSARYLLVSRGFIIVQALVVFSVLSFLLTGARMEAIDRLGPRADIIITMLVIAASVGLLTLLNQRVMPVIDRRFFRESYDAHQVLSELGNEMRHLTTVEQLLERTSVKIQDALHVENVTIFLPAETGSDFRSAICNHLAEDGNTTSNFDRTLQLPGRGVIVEKMRRAAFPLPVDFDRTWSWTQELLAQELTNQQSQRDEIRTLRRIRAALLLPITTKEELLGVISLGPRLGDLPFSKEDKSLLMSVALQMALAMQNAQLVQQVAEEERLRHELAIATTVQRRLFPACPPQLQRVELAGVCHPARGVGGDYYDFIVLEGGKVGIAVADVAGKGISAALLMSTVQASLRSHAPSVNGRLTDLASAMNRLLHLSTDSNDYATFFYAQFCEETDTLTYVNAGHNPPMVIRAAAAERALSAGQAATFDRRPEMMGDGNDDYLSRFSLLTTGGPIIGAFHHSCYEQESIAMQNGDLLVAYTDGVTEARNPNEQEFGEERLQSLLAQVSHLSAQEITERVVESVRQWCGDMPQHDDLTLVVMKVR